MLDSSIFEYLRAGVEILLLWLVLYQCYRMFHATRGARILAGLFFCFIALLLLSTVFNLHVITWILTRIFGPGLALALVIIFQPELRTGLAKLGSKPFFKPFFSRFSNKQENDFLDSFCKAIEKLSNNRIGALFAFERSISLASVGDTGVQLDAIFSPELAQTIFFAKTLLHDGGVIIVRERMASAGCLFPLSQKELPSRAYGLRHRAAVGISEESDCIAVAVSEETGGISCAVGGELKTKLKLEDLKNFLSTELLNNDAHVTEQTK